MSEVYYFCVKCGKKIEDEKETSYCKDCRDKLISVLEEKGKMEMKG